MYKIIIFRINKINTLTKYLMWTAKMNKKINRTIKKKNASKILVSLNKTFR